jgi:hypothetical protein
MLSTTSKIPQSAANAVVIGRTAIHFLPGRVRRKTALVNRILQVAS